MINKSVNGFHLIDIFPLFSGVKLTVSAQLIVVGYKAMTHIVTIDTTS